ncbi:hypothetical protein ACTXT7_015565 [Hymenolepis weldensis]
MAIVADATPISLFDTPNWDIDDERSAFELCDLSATKKDHFKFLLNLCPEKFTLSTEIPDYNV